MAAVAMVNDAVFRASANLHADTEVAELLHDLRQPLSAIEAIAYYLEMTVPARHVEAHAMLLKLQAIVQDAGVMIERAEERIL